MGGAGRRWSAEAFGALLCVVTAIEGDAGLLAEALADGVAPSELVAPGVAAGLLALLLAEKRLAAARKTREPAWRAKAKT